MSSDISTDRSGPTTGLSPASRAYTPTGRLAGNLGSVIVRHCLREGAVVVLSGRTRAKLDAMRNLLGLTWNTLCAAAPLRRCAAAQSGRLGHQILTIFSRTQYCGRVSYPNRSDYAVSKSGQRAMVETMAHAAVVKALRRGQRVEALLAHLAANDVAALAMDGDAPRELRELGMTCHKDRSDDCTWAAAFSIRWPGRRRPISAG